MLVTIAGCGALGSLIAARLLEAGHPVQGYQRPGPQLQALRAEGLTLAEDRDGGTRRYRFKTVTAEAGELSPSRLIIVLVKAYDTASLAPLKGLLTEDGLVLSLQNGLGNAEVLAELFGAERVAAGVATYGAFRTAPGVVNWGGEGFITLGPWRPGGGCSWIANLLQGAGLNATAVDDPRPAIWQKLVINAMLNPVTALTGLRNGEARAIPATLELMRQLGRETVAAAARDGILLDFDALWEQMQTNLERTAVNRTSMLQDVSAGRRTENEYISGGVLRFSTHDEEFPCTRTIYRLLQAIDCNNTGSG